MDRVSSLGFGVKLRFKDLGDDTFAMVVAGAEGDQEIDLSAIGSPTDPAWNGSSPSASLISIMKACYGQLKIIADNTGV